MAEGAAGVGLLASDCDPDAFFGNLFCDSVKVLGVGALVGAAALASVSVSSFQRASRCGAAREEFELTIVSDPKAPAYIRERVLRKHQKASLLPHCVAAQSAIRAEHDPEKRIVLVRATPSECF